MKIRELNIDVFGGLENKHLCLQEGLNLIEGENESGKSTIMLFIKFMLYGMPRKGNEERDRSVNRSTHCARGSMTVSHKGEEYRIERSFTEGSRGGTERLNLYRLSDGEEVGDGQEPGEFFLKVPKEVFESSAFVGQMMCRISGGKKGADSIRNLLTTADEQADLSKIEERLESIRKGYRHRSGKGGKLPDMSGAIHMEKQRLEKAVADGLRKNELEEKSARLSLQCAEAEERLKKANGALRQAAKLDLLHRFDALHEKEERLTRSDEELNRLRAAEPLSRFPLEEQNAARLYAFAEQLESAEEKTRIAEHAYEHLNGQSDFDEEEAEIGARLEREGGTDALLLRMDRMQSSKKTLRVLGGLLLLGGITCVILCGFLWEYLIGIIAGALVASVGGFLWIRSFSVSSRAVDLAEEYGTDVVSFEEALLAYQDALHKKRVYGTRLSAAEEALRVASTYLRELTERTERELTRYGERKDRGSVSEQARACAERIRSFLAAYHAAQTRREVLRASIAEDERMLAAYDEHALRAELDGVGIVAEATVTSARAEQELRWAQTQRDLLLQKKESVETERISLSATVEDPMPIADRLRTMQAEYDRAEEYYEALEMALEALRDAGDAMSGNITPILGKRAGEIMTYLSGGRYSDFFAGKDLVPALEHQDGIRVPSELLSGGTADAAYLSLRISLMLQIYEGELPPLILDESLCQLDDGRMGRMLELLSRLCQGQFQCLLFTCQSREAACCHDRGFLCHTVRL
ncbi:MAG: AAA family ATPase [Clostridia bacterium]|nr:AAA family ATPase [Clostridia bacterium]